MKKLSKLVLLMLFAITTLTSCEDRITQLGVKINTPNNQCYYYADTVRYDGGRVWFKGERHECTNSQCSCTDVGPDVWRTNVAGSIISVEKREPVEEQVSKRDAGRRDNGLIVTVIFSIIALIGLLILWATTIAKKREKRKEAEKRRE